MRMVAASRFRYSAALFPWTDAQLEELFMVWLQVERATWELQGSFPSAQFRLPSDSAGTPACRPQPSAVNACLTARGARRRPPRVNRQSISTAVLELRVHERARAAWCLAAETQPRQCPIARLLRACGQLGIDIKAQCRTGTEAAATVTDGQRLTGRLAADMTLRLTRI